MSACGLPGGCISRQESPSPKLPMCRPEHPCPCRPLPSPHLGAAPPASFSPEQCKPAALGGRPARTCSWPRMMTPWGLMACQEARFSPAPRCSPSWYADHLPSRVVHATQTWCQALSFRLSGSWATFVRRARARRSVGLPGHPSVPPAPCRASGAPPSRWHPKFYRHLDVLLLPLKTHPGEPSSLSSSSSCLPAPPWAPSSQLPHTGNPRSIISRGGVEAGEMRAGASLPSPLRLR